MLLGLSGPEGQLEIGLGKTFWVKKVYFPLDLDKGYVRLPWVVRNPAQHQHLVLNPDAGTENWSVQGSIPQLQLPQAEPKAAP